MRVAFNEMRKAWGKSMGVYGEDDSSLVAVYGVLYHYAGRLEEFESSRAILVSRRSRLYDEIRDLQPAVSFIHIFRNALANDKSGVATVSMRIFSQFLQGSLLPLHGPRLVYLPSPPKKLSRLVQQAKVSLYVSHRSVIHRRKASVGALHWG